MSSDSIITAIVLLGLMIIGYAKYTNKTLPEIVREVRDSISELISPTDIIETKGGIT